MTERILVMRSGALGDFVLGLPALRALRDTYPRASLHLLAPGPVLPLASSLADIATPLERAEVAWLFSEDADVPDELAGPFGNLGLAVLWMADTSGTVARNFRRLGARRILQAPAFPSAPGHHAADHLLETLTPLGISLHFPAVPRLVPDEAARAEATLLRGSLGVTGDRPAVAVHPGSGGEWKRWPPERFARVAEALMAAGAQVVLIQGPADEVAVEQLLAALPGRRPPVAANLSARQLAAFISLFNCYLGNDSGVTHLAAAAGTPVVALFGPTDPAVWGPRGPKVTILQAGMQPEQGLEGTSAEQVLRAVRETLSASGWDEAARDEPRA